jgi:hypothetical protein
MGGADFRKERPSPGWVDALTKEDPMADEEKRTFDPGTVSSNRAQMQGLGVGQKELNMQQAPNRDAYATAPQRTEPFDERLDETTNADRPQEADFGEEDLGDGRREGVRAESDGAAQRVGDLGVGTPAGVDVHDLGQDDKPQQEWGPEADEGMMHSADHTRRGVTEADRSQGAKTRRMTKDIISRRAPH